MWALILIKKISCVFVSAVHCPPLEVTDPHVTARVEGSRLGHTAVFQCPTGFVLNGTSNLTCHATGKTQLPFSIAFCVRKTAPRGELAYCQISNSPRQQI